MTRSAPLAAALALAVLPARVGRAEPDVQVEVRECAWLDDERLRRQLGLELATLPEAARHVNVVVRCEGHDALVSVAPAGGELTFERRVRSLCCDEVEPERVVAFLAGGLLRAAAPLRIEPAPRVDPPACPAAPPAPAVCPPAPVAPAPWVAPPPLPSARSPERVVATRAHELALAGLVALQPVDGGLLVGGGALGYRGWVFPWLAAGAQATGRFARPSFDAGDVDVRVLTLDASLTAAIVAAGRFGLSVSLFGGPALVQLDGQARDAAFAEATLSGFTANVGLSLEPRLGGDRWSIGAPLRLGYLGRAPRATVGDDGELRVDGPWAGAALELGWSLGDPVGRAR